ncbi:MAG: FHA domain-containing protein [Chloroflexi bacterium]|nr:FHA domain-containing protein [Chloroflexota bacterium]
MEREVAMLILQRSEGSGGRWPLENEVTRIGRSPDCEIILPERVVSREHAQIERREDAYYLFDLGSKNGTFVNGEPVGQVGYRLQDGDEIQIALRFRLTFVDAGATAPLTLDAPISASTPTLHLDDTQRSVQIRGRTLTPPLSAAQYRLLSALVAADGAVISRDEVVRVVWPDAEGSGVSEQAIDALVRRLRERLAELEPNHQYIVTVRGHGFRLDNPK